MFAIGSIAVDELGGYWFVERAMPFNNEHLAHEATEGHYSPLPDPVFWAFEVAVAVLVFGFGAYVGVSGASTQHRLLVAVPVAVAIALRLGDDLWSGDRPAPFRTAAAMCVLLYVAASWVGGALAARRSAHPARL